MEMRLSELKVIDKSLKWAFPEEELWQTSVSSLTGLEGLKKNAIIFIKDKKFFMSLGQKDFHQSLGLGIIFAQKLWQEVSTSDDWKALATKVSYALIAPDINLSIAQLSRAFYDAKVKNLNNMVDGRQMGTCEIHPTAWLAQNIFIADNVKIGANVRILSGCVIMSAVEIGEHSTLYPNITLYPWTKIGKNCRLHSGLVIGADGYGYHFHRGEHKKIWHMGGVEIADNVEIGANTTIDMGTFGPTVIGAGTKIDNQVHIGHNNHLGRGVIICGKVGTAGSVSIGDFSVLGGEASIGPHVSVGAECEIAGAAKVVQDLAPKSKVAGHPARPINEWLRGLAYVRRNSLRKKAK